MLYHYAFVQILRAIILNYDKHYRMLRFFAMPDYII